MLISLQPLPLYGEHDRLRPDVFRQVQVALRTRLGRNPQDVADPLFRLILERTQSYRDLHDNLVSKYGNLLDLCGRQVSVRSETFYCPFLLTLSWSSPSAGLAKNVRICPSIKDVFRRCLWTYSRQIYPCEDVVPAPIPAKKC